MARLFADPLASPSNFFLLTTRFRPHICAYTVNDLSRKALYGLHFGQFEAALDKAMKRKGGSGDHFSLLLFFGHTEQEGLADLGRQIFDQLPCPSLKVDFRH